MIDMFGLTVGLHPLLRACAMPSPYQQFLNREPNMDQIPWLLVFVVLIGLLLLGVGKIIERRWEKLGRPHF